MSEREEVLLEPGFVLHLRPYRNSSLIIDCLTAQYGRQALVAQAARRAEKRQRSELQPFRHVRFSWVRRGDMGRLTHVEADGAPFELAGESLLGAYYVNELLMRLVPRGDHNAAITNCYSSGLAQLAGSMPVAKALRLFELDLLEALGFGIDLQHDCRTGEPIERKRHYIHEFEGGMTVSPSDDTMSTYSGEHLISLRRRELGDTASLRAARRLLGGVLEAHLGDRPLKTRAVMQDIVSMGFSR